MAKRKKVSATKVLAIIMVIVMLLSTFGMLIAYFVS